MNKGTANILMAEILYKRNSRIDGVLSNVALHAAVVCAFFVSELRKGSAHVPHLSGSAPCAANYLSNTTHCLGVGTNNRNCPHIVQDVLCSNCLTADSGFCESDIFGNRFVQVMADHEHLSRAVSRCLRYRE